MSRSQEKKNLRWSEPVLHRHLPLLITSENESSSIQQSKSTSPIITKSFEQKIITDFCLCCNNTKIKKNKFKSQIQNNNCDSETKKFKESLKLQFIASQVDQSLKNDKQMALIQHLDLAISMLEALLHHVQSIKVFYLSASRIFNLGHQLISIYPCSNKSNISQITNLNYYINQIECYKEKELRQLNEIIKICSIDISITEQFQIIMKDHLIRKKNLIIAAKNFNNLISQSKLNSLQIKKLLQQYESILNIYQCSYENLNMELPKMMQLQLIALSQGLQMITQFYNDQDTKIISNLFKLISDYVLQDLSKGYKIKQDICPKCKINQLDKK